VASVKNSLEATLKKLFALLVFLLAACTPAIQSPDTPVDSGQRGGGLEPVYAPRAGDDQLLRGEIFLDSAEVLAMESFPVQYSVLLKGNLSSPCHEFRAVYNPQDASNAISIEAYSVAKPDAVCVAMLQPFEQSIYIGTLPAGHYTIWVNDKLVAEFDA